MTAQPETTTQPHLTTTRVPLDSLTMWEGNARRGVVSKIKESMRVNGVFHPLDVQTNSRRIIAGNHRYKALLELHAEDPEDERWGPDVDVILHDVSDKRALKMHLADNKTADDASWDNDALVEQLRQAVEDESLEGTGFDDDDLQDLLDGLEEPTDAAWGDAMESMPDGDPTIKTRNFTMTPAQDTIVGEALDAARARMGDHEGNVNGAALAYLAQEFLDAIG